jgi:hypothetical protein
MLEGLTDAHLNLEPQPGLKTAGWILGHLCISGDYALKVCGGNPRGPREWRQIFSPGTQPALDSTTYPKMSELCETFRAIYSELCERYPKVDESTLTPPTPVDIAREAFPTLREFVPYLMTSHLSYHLAQLGDWRRAAGIGHKGYL